MLFTLEYYHDVFVVLFCLFFCSFLFVVVVFIFFTSHVIEYVKGLASPFKQPDIYFVKYDQIMKLFVMIMKRVEIFWLFFSFLFFLSFFFFFITEHTSIFVSPERSSERDYVVTDSVRSMCMYVVCVCM